MAPPDTVTVIRDRGDSDEHEHANNDRRPDVAEGVAEPRLFAEEACRGLSASDVRKVMYENGMRFMGLPV